MAGWRLSPTAPSFWFPLANRECWSDYDTVQYHSGRPPKNLLKIKAESRLELPALWLALFREKNVDGAKADD